MNDRLFRSRDDRMLAGVAGGLAEMWDADPSLVRIVWALLVPFTGGIALLVYIVMAIVVPEEPYAYPTTFGAVPPAPSDPTAPPPAGAAAPVGSGWVTPDTSRQDARAARHAARAARRAERSSTGSGVSGGLVGGLVLVGLGVFFLAREWLPQLDFDWVWPLILVGIGVILLVSALGRGPRDPGGSA
ncbi:MAG: PspC domain-containing protein [Candidatus Limnocylindrales bacterium]